MPKNAPANDAQGNVDSLPLNEFLGLSIEKRMSAIKVHPARILEVLDSWNDYVYMEGYDEDVGDGVLYEPKAQYKFRLLTETLTTWADEQQLSNVATDMHEYLAAVMAAYKPGPPWGRGRTKEQLGEIWRKAWAARERLMKKAFIVINERRTTIKISRQELPHKPLSPLAQDILLTHLKEGTNEYNLLAVKPAQGKLGLLDILARAGRSSDEKEVNKATKELKGRGFYLSKPGPKGGGYITDSGRLEAERIISSR